MSARVLAVETSCDETAAAVLRHPGEVLSSVVASQVEIHREYGGVVPEVASRNHLPQIRPVIQQALAESSCRLEQVDVFAATAGPGLASSLLIGHASAKALALAQSKPFIGINHLEGHLLSPYIGRKDGVRAGVGLIVSGGHTQLVQVHGPGNYTVIGSTRDDAAGEAFDKVARMLDLPYPGGPEIDRLARDGDPRKFKFPRGTIKNAAFDFSFSGLKTSVLYTLEKLDRPWDPVLPDICASFQEAVVDVLVGKSIAASRYCGVGLLGVSGGVSCNRRLRESLEQQCREEGVELLLCEPALTTDNAAMIAHVAGYHHAAGRHSSLGEDVNPNLKLC